MDDGSLRVAVLGAGGVGGLVGGLLARLGDEVVFLGGGASAEALRERGIEVRSRLVGDLREPVGVAAELEREVDVCLVAVKAADLDASLRRVPPAALGSALLVPFLNGVEHVDVLRRRYPEARVVAASIRVESARTAPGVIEQTSPFATVEIAVRPEVEGEVGRLADHLRRAGLEVSLREDEAGLLWGKLVFLAPLAVLTTHSGAPAGVVRTERRDDLLAMVDEIASVAAAAGASVDAPGTVAALDAVPATMTSSMQRDAAQGRPIELEAIGGAIVRAAAHAGVPVPVTERLVEELRARLSSSGGGGASNPTAWPPLALDDWRDTFATLRLWTQVVGKIRLASSPATNHWWNITLHLTSRGLTTTPMFHGARVFQIDLDLVDHRLAISTAEGDRLGFPLVSLSVAAFYRQTMRALRDLGLEVPIHAAPVELPEVVPFAEDEEHRTYDPEHANRFWRILLQVERVLSVFRARFLGKVSPIHFFWGGGDLAVTRFSGRPAPEFTSAIPNCPPWVMTEAYSHEVSSCGFWPGGDGVDTAFYSYAYPEPAGFRDRLITVEGAHYDPNVGEFLLPYADMRRASDPDAALLDFLQQTYEAAADLAGWDRAALERADRPRSPYAETAQLLR